MSMSTSSLRGTKQSHPLRLPPVKVLMSFQGKHQFANWFAMTHFFYSPLSRFLISGNSMSPTFLPNQEVLVFHWAFLLTLPRKNDIVIVRSPKDGRLLIKRIKKMKDKKYFIVGDNEKESTDSRGFGWVKKGSIMGKVIRKL